MQHRQLNYKNILGATALALAAFFLPGQAIAAGAQAGDPILDGGPPGPCDPGTAGADYSAGTDVNGHPVAPADLETAPVPVPGQMLIPLKTGQNKGRGRGDPLYVQADGKKLEALLNPPPACPAPAAKPGK